MVNFSIYKIPTDFNSFINTIYSDLETHIKRKLFFYNTEAQSILSGFIIYMLETNKTGIIRYKNYDGIKYPNIAYNKWFFSQLNFFILKNHRNCVFDFDGGFDLKLDEYPCYSISNFGMPDSNLLLKEIEEFLENYSKSRPDSFSSRAYSLYLYKMRGYKHKEVASFLDVSVSTITVWLERLQGLIEKHVNYVGYSNNLIRT